MIDLDKAFHKVLTEYPAASKQVFARHPLAEFLRKEFPEIVENNLANDAGCKISGSAGQGNWARSPWVGIFHPQITDSAQRGYYPVYLFREDFSGLYLSLNQGMTEARESYKSDAKDALKARAEDFRARLGNGLVRFDQEVIDLKPSSPSNDSAFYEAGNIIAKFYPASSIPSEEVLKADLSEMLALYQQLIYSDPVLTDKQTQEDDEQDNPFYEDLRTLRIHKRVERNAKLAKEVKRLQGYACKLCGLNFEERYGEIGKGYIEAHHLTSVSKVKGQKLARDPRTDFAVLCANCHRMVHRSEYPHDLEAFRKKYLINK